MENQKKTTKKKQKVSISYTLKAITKNIIVLEKAGYINLEDGKIMNEIKKKAVEKYMKEQFE